MKSNTAVSGTSLRSTLARGFPSQNKIPPRHFLPVHGRRTPAPPFTFLKAHDSFSRASRNFWAIVQLNSKTLFFRSALTFLSTHSLTTTTRISFTCLRERKKEREARKTRWLKNFTSHIIRYVGLTGRTRDVVFCVPLAYASCRVEQEEGVWCCALQSAYQVVFQRFVQHDRHVRLRPATPGEVSVIKGRKFLNIH